MFESEFYEVSEKIYFLVVLTLNINKKQKNKKLYTCIKFFLKSVQKCTKFLKKLNYPDKSLIWNSLTEKSLIRNGFSNDRFFK